MGRCAWFTDEGLFAMRFTFYVPHYGVLGSCPRSLTFNRILILDPSIPFGSATVIGAGQPVESCVYRSSA